MIHIYLVRRDQSAVRILATLEGNTHPATRLNLSRLDLPDHIRRPLEDEIQRNNMLWEAWIEGTNDLKTSLQQRGINAYPQKPETFVKDTCKIDQVTLRRSIS